MDTRSKILTVDDACRLAEPLTVVTGTFDLLRAGHARELAAAKGPNTRLLVLVMPSATAPLDQRARARMVAALRVVDYVLAADHDDLVQVSRAHPGAQIARLETADARRMRLLIDHVERR